MSELKYLIDNEGEATSLSLSEDNDRGGSPGFLSQEVKISSDYHYKETLTYPDIEILKRKRGLPEIIRYTADNTDSISTTFTVFESQIQKRQSFCIRYKHSIRDKHVYVIGIQFLLNHIAVHASYHHGKSGKRNEEVPMWCRIGKGGLVYKTFMCRSNHYLCLSTI